MILRTYKEIWSQIMRFRKYQKQRFKIDYFIPDHIKFKFSAKTIDRLGNLDLDIEAFKFKKELHGP